MRRRGRSLRVRTVVLTLIGLLVSMVPVLNLVPASAAGSNLALGKTATASSANGQYVAANLNDGNQDSYWESTGSFPAWAQVDLGSATSVNQVVLKLPSSWGARTETLSVQGSTDGSTFSTVVASAGYTFDPSSSNAVTINFGATSTRYLRINITANTGWAAGQISELEVYGSGTNGTSANLALGKTMSSSGVSQTYAASNANDGNQATYWESTNNAFPQWLQVDLGASVSVNQVVLKVPADTSWATRTQTLTVQGSSDGSTFSTLVPSAGYTFNPSTGNTSTISFTATTTRYIRITITANTGWPAGQISELEVYGPTSGDTTPPSAPTNLAYTQPQTGQIALTWSASTDNVGVTGYDIYANNSLLTSVAGSVLSYTDTQPASATVSYFVRAHDAAGNQSGNSNTVTRTGQSGDTTAPTAPTNLAYTQPQSGQIALTWGAATDNVGVTGYDIYRNGALATTVGGSTLTYTDAQPDTATVSYYVKAHDAAGNQSSASNTVTRTGSGGTGSNLAVGKPITGTANTFTYAPANANDNDLTTYFEGSTYPSQLTVSLGANADVTSVVVKLNPDAAWSTRTQTIAVLGREQSATGFTTIAAAQTYTFNPSTGNSVSIPVSARVSDVELSITSNSGAPGGQVAEFQVIGTPAPNPDLVVSSSSWSPTSPVETDPVTVSATVKNSGTAASGATNVNFYLGTTKVGTAAVGALAVGASSTVSANIGTQTAGSYPLTAKVDEANTVIELNDGNNSYTNPTNLVVAPVQSSDLIASAVSSSPGTPSAGNTVTFSVTLKNQGTVASASGAHAITLTLLDSNNSVVKTLNGSYSGSLAPGATGAPVSMGTWTAVNGKYTLHTVIAIDANELSVKQANNISDTPFYVGRGANMPYDVYEAENGMIGGGAAVVGPNRTIGDLAGEASGRKAVTLDSTGSYVQWNTTDPTNTLVTRFNIPDAPGGGGTTATLDVYVNGTFLQTITLNSKYEWLYGAETGPGNDPSAGSPRHVYDEAHIMLNQTVPADSVIKLQKDAANTSQYAIDYINTEMVAPVANPNPATYVTPAGFGQQDVQNALTQVANDTTGKLVGVYLPAGQYQTTSKFQVSGKAVKVVGAGPWYTQFNAPTTQDNTDVGWSVQSSANGSSFSGFGWFGDYTSRIDGPGKVFDLTDVSNLTIDNIWIEHQVVAIWGTHVTGLTATNMRIRDTFADGINLTNGSSGNLVSNDEARSTGDDSFALFAAQDHNSSDLTNNTFQNLSALTPWRAAGIAVYGGENNIMQNLYVADTLTYAGITISSLNFGYPFQGFGTQPTTIQNVSLVRDGGHFWNGQVFPAIWVFSATQPFQGIRVNSVDITDPTYSGIMFQTDYVGSTAQYPVTDTIFTDVSITGAQQSGDAYNAKSGYGIWANQLPEAGQGPAVGTAVFNHLTESNNYVNIQNTTSTFTITVNP
ncbi:MULTISPECIES: discoidin domain-containing protein [Streptacidiphilus]|uniref:Discoidin domain-containing protein n=1 Tax=Streptacidiphilus cavernicola TaxID=3342716 RepID=A0ABV6UQY3_9ACTN|nr:discoidin domain-containing protein [Streptacidiphilus jeojiense]